MSRPALVVSLIGLCLPLSQVAAQSSASSPVGHPQLILSGLADYAEHELGWSTRGRLDGRLRVPLSGLVRGELSALGGWSRPSWTASAGGFLVGGGLTGGGETAGVALRAGYGMAFPAGLSQHISRLETSAWSRLAGLDLELMLRQTGISGTGSASRDPRSGGFEDTLTASPRRRYQEAYVDAELNLGWVRRSLELEAGLGRRFGQASLRTGSWRLGGLFWFSEHLGFSVTTGLYPTDAISGQPRGHYTTVGLRVRLRDTGAQTPVPPPLTQARPEFRVIQSAEQEYAIQFFAPQARQVELAGSFSDWSPVAMQKGTNGWWSGPVRLPPGIHEMNLRVNGGPWEVPPGVPAIRDDFGGLVGVLTLPPAER